MIYRAHFAVTIEARAIVNIEASSPEELETKIRDFIDNDAQDTSFEPDWSDVEDYRVLIVDDEQGETALTFDDCYELMKRIENPDNGDLGPYDTEEEAVMYAEAEIGLAWQIIETGTGKFYIEILVPTI